MANPLELLQKMQRDSMARMPTLPQEEEPVEYWSGVGFRVGEMNLVAPLDHVSEVLHVENYTVIPGTRSWLKGVANVRGNLITIVDLPEFFGRKPVFIDQHSRVLVMNVEGLNTALLVDDVFGLRHFEESDRQKVSSVDDALGSYLSGAFLREGSLWGVFDFNALAESAAFRAVGAH
jgi:twitching motility protein PilI